MRNILKTGIPVGSLTGIPFATAAGLHFGSDPLRPPVAGLAQRAGLPLSTV